MTTPTDDEVRLPKEVFVLNTLAMGIAIQLLAKFTGENIKDWESWIWRKAAEQYKQLSIKQIQEIADKTKA